MEVTAKHHLWNFGISRRRASGMAQNPNVSWSDLGSRGKNKYDIQIQQKQMLILVLCHMLVTNC